MNLHTNLDLTVFNTNRTPEMADDPQAGVNEINAERSLRHIYELSAWLVMRGWLPKAGRTPAVPFFCRRSTDVRIKLLCTLKPSRY